MLEGQDWAVGERPWDAASLNKDPLARGRLIYNRAGGPGQAAELLRGGRFAEDVASAGTVWLRD